MPHTWTWWIGRALFPSKACHSLGWMRKNNLAALCQCNAAWKIVDEAFEKAVAESSNHLFISASLCVGFSLVNDHFIKIHCVLANKIGRRPAFMYFHELSSRSLCMWTSARTCFTFTPKTIFSQLISNRLQLICFWANYPRGYCVKCWNTNHNSTISNGISFCGIQRQTQSWC